jgi:hypothetical protein
MILILDQSVKRRGPFIVIAAVVFIVASVGLAQCTLVEPTWDMAVPVQIIATSEVPEVERWSAALATAVTDLGGHPTMSRTTQAIWLTSSTYSWCDPTFNGRYVMYVMRSAAKQPSAIFVCWRVTSAGGEVSCCYSPVPSSGTHRKSSRKCDL